MSRSGAGSGKDDAMSGELDGVYQYVRHEDVPEWLARGWELVGVMPGHHGYWCVIMRWAGEGEPPAVAFAPGGMGP